MDNRITQIEKKIHVTETSCREDLADIANNFLLQSIVAIEEFEKVS
jgi:hypothetical protein